MSKSQTKIASPARSQGAITPRRPRTRRTLSSASPAQSKGRLSTVVEKFIKSDKFVLSPMKRKSVLPDDTEIEAPRRASWWKRLEGSSREVFEALDTNKMTDDLLVEEYEFEVERDEKLSQSVQQSQSSDNESVASIVVPRRTLFNQKKQSQAKFGEIMGKSLGKTNIEDQSIEVAPKNLFNKGPRNLPIFPAALLNSTNKTINKTVEPETNKPRPNLFGQAGTKRKKMFTDFVMSDDSEEDSEIQHKVFGFNKNNNKRLSLGTRNRRMPSLTPSMTTEIDIDDWNLLPSSTMIGSQETSKVSDIDMEQMQEGNQDDTLTEANASLNHDANRTDKKSMIQSDENDRTLTNENIEDANNSQDLKKVSDEAKKVSESVKNRTLQNKSAKQLSNLSNTENVEIEEVVLKQQQNSVRAPNHLAKNEQSLEDKMAELHGESIVKEASRSNLLSNRTEKSPDIPEEPNSTNHIIDGERRQNLEQSIKKQEIQNATETADILKQNKNVSEKEKTQEELNESTERQKSRNGLKDVSNTNQDEDMEVMLENNKIYEEIEPSEKQQDSKSHSEEAEDKDNDYDKSDEEIEASAEEQESQEQSEEANKTNKDTDESEEEVEPSVEEHESRDQSEEANKTNEDKDESEEVDPSVEEHESRDQSEEESKSSQNEDMDKSEKEQEPSLEEQEIQPENESNQDEVMNEKDQSGEEIDEEHQDDDMEAMVWNDNDDEKRSDSLEKETNAEAIQMDEDETNAKSKESGENEGILKQNANKSKNVTNKSTKIVDASINDDRREEEDEVVEETPNNSTHDTTGRKRKKDVSAVKSPEVVLQNMTNDNESFRPIGRSTTFRKSKSVYETMNMRHSLAPVQESTLGSEASRESSTEGSEWDSHRTTRKTIRQTLGKEYTTRKSLRALVMEQSAKRQTEIYNKNMSKFDKTKNKTVAEDGTDKNASKINKTKNKTVMEDAYNKNASTVNKTRNKTFVEYTNNDNASKINKTKNKSVLEDIDDHHIRLRRTSNRNLSSNQSPNSKPHVLATSLHHMPDPLIPEHQASYHKSIHDIKEPEISEQNLLNAEESVNIPIPDNNDSGPEISMNASYCQGMSADVSDHEVSDVEMFDKENTIPKIINKEISRRDASMRSKSIRNSDQDVLDYEASEQAISEQDESLQESVQDEKDAEESDNEEEVEQEVESEQENEEYSQQEIEPDSEHEETQEEDEESQQEIEEQEQSQQEIESDQEESQQEIEQEPESEEEQQESENELDHDMSQENGSDQESDRDVSQEQENDMSEDNDDFISGLNSKYKTPDSNRVSRVVFDSNMMSIEEIDFEGVSRQTDNDITEESEREPEITRASLPVVSEPSRDEKLMQMQRIAQQNMERRQKIREEVQKSLKPPSQPNLWTEFISLVQTKYSIRRMNQTEPKKPKRKPKPTGIPAGALPKAFLEDLKYKPPKRFQPANAPWITKRLYKFLEAKLEPKYDYRARVRAEELVQSIHSFAKLVRRRALAPPQAVDELKREMARLRIVTTHHDFYDFFHEFMPKEIRIKVNPSLVNKIPMPRDGVFSEILQSRPVFESVE